MFPARMLGGLRVDLATRRTPRLDPVEEVSAGLRWPQGSASCQEGIRERALSLKRPETIAEPRLHR